MDQQKAKQRINYLRQELDKHNYNYYVLSKPQITDFEYDHLLRELIDLESSFPEFYSDLSPSLRVGNDSNQNFEQSEHERLMLSLGNTYSFDDLDQFDQRVQKALAGQKYAYCCELKYDGTSISIHYINGILKKQLPEAMAQKVIL